MKRNKRLHTWAKSRPQPQHRYPQHQANLMHQEMVVYAGVWMTRNKMEHLKHLLRQHLDPIHAPEREE